VGVIFEGHGNINRLLTWKFELCGWFDIKLVNYSAESGINIAADYTGLASYLCQIFEDLDIKFTAVADDVKF
jgi:hypothetical protein